MSTKNPNLSDSSSVREENHQSQTVRHTNANLSVRDRRTHSMSIDEAGPSKAASENEADDESRPLFPTRPVIMNDNAHDCAIDLIDSLSECGAAERVDQLGDAIDIIDSDWKPSSQKSKLNLMTKVKRTKSLKGPTKQANSPTFLDFAADQETTQTNTVVRATSITTSEAMKKTKINIQKNPITFTTSNTHPNATQAATPVTTSGTSIHGEPGPMILHSSDPQACTTITQATFP
ncbi:MAG: hypothetical protein Q9169_008335 [Polycauliona sp. 2 TL-2023]